VRTPTRACDSLRGRALKPFRTRSATDGPESEAAAGSSMTWNDDDIDAPQDIDLEDGDEPSFDKCPICGRMIPESADRCPYCGQWLLGETTAGRRSLGWLWPVMVAILIAIILVIWHRFSF